MRKFDGKMCNPLQLNIYKKLFSGKIVSSHALSEFTYLNFCLEANYFNTNANTHFFLIKWNFERLITAVQANCISTFKENKLLNFIFEQNLNSFW